MAHVGDAMVLVDVPALSQHPRAGTLTFGTPIPAGATVELRITSLSTDVVATWTVTGS